MFAQKEIDKIDLEYFRVIQFGGYAITLQSKNTQHCWHIVSQVYGGKYGCQILHAHSMSHAYHIHSKAKTLRDAIRSIQEHDDYVLRKKKEKGEKNTRKMIGQEGGVMT